MNMRAVEIQLVKSMQPSYLILYTRLYSYGLTLQFCVC